MSSPVEAAAAAALPADRVRVALASTDGRHTVVRHDDLPEPVHSPEDVARQLGIPIARITKTLLVTDRSEQARFALVVLPVTSRVEFAALAAALGWPRAIVAPARHLADEVAQPVYAVSPFGAGLPVVVDASVADGTPVLVGAGAVGVEIRLDPRTLVAVTGALVAPVTGTGPSVARTSPDPARDEATEQSINRSAAARTSSDEQ